VNVLLAVLWKDLVSEWRSRDRVMAMLLFSLLVVVVFHFALPVEPEQTQAVAPGLLWVAYIFAAILGLNRSFAQELEQDALSGLALAPAERGWIFLGKAIANLALIGVVQLVTAFAFALAMDVDLLAVAVRLAGVVALASIGLCSVGTLFSAMSARTQFRELLLPILLLPPLIPVIAGAVQATSELIRTGAVPFEALQLLIVVDGIYLIVSFLAFDYVLDE